MKNVNLKGAVLAAALASILWAAPAALAQDIILDQPRLEGGPSLMEALKNRQSHREFSEADLSLAELSDILWAASGVNRPAEGGKPGLTAPSSHGKQATEVYAVTKDGAYKYDPAAHELKLIKGGDHRKLTGVQGYVAQAPLNLIYVADLPRVPGDQTPEKLINAAYDSGHISQNVYLYCAANNLNVVVRSSIDKEAIRKLLNLENTYEPLLGQTVGRPVR